MTDREIPPGISIITIIRYIQEIFGIAAGIFLVADKEALAHELSGNSESTLLSRASSPPLPLNDRNPLRCKGSRPWAHLDLNQGPHPYQG